MSDTLKHRLLIQASKGSKKTVQGVGEIVIVECGLSHRNGNGDIFYFEESILDDAAKFVGAKIFADHASWGSPSVKDEIGFVQSAKRDDANKRIVGQVVITDPVFKEKFDNYPEDSTELLKFSIRAMSDGEQKKDPSGVGYEPFIRVSRINQVFSVDHVFEGASGGRLLVYQSAGVEQSNTNKEFAMNEKELRDKIAEQDKELAQSRADLLAEKAKVTALETEQATLTQNLATQRIEANKVMVAQTLAASPLPQVAKDKIAGGMNMETVTAETLTQTIAAEIAYLTTTGWKPVDPATVAQTTSPVVGMGASAPVQVAQGAITDPEKDPLFISKKSSYLSQGLDEKTAILKAKKFCGFPV